MLRQKINSVTSDNTIYEKPDNLLIQDKDKKNVGFLSTQKLSEILKR